MDKRSHTAPITADDASVTVASGQTISEAIDLYGCTLAGIHVPSTFDGTTITLLTAPTIGGTYNAVQDGDGNTFTITTAASRYAPIKNLAVVAGIRFLKLQCGSSQTTTDSVFALAVRPV